MSQAKTINRTALDNRKVAAQAILMGYADGDVATVLATAATAGFVAGRLPDRGAVDVNSQL